MLRYLFLIILTWQSTDQLMLGVERTVNIITLFCSNEQGQRINLETNTTVKFYLNRTLTGTSTSRDELGQIVTLLISGTTVTFVITPSLEGYFACGSSTGSSNSLVFSQPKPLIGELILDHSKFYATVVSIIINL